MRQPFRPIAIGLVATVLVACSTPTASGSPAGTPAAEPTPAAGSPSAAPSGAESPAPTTEPIPSEDLAGDFTCDLPIHVDQTVARANITDVRIGSHEGYDRVVFEFRDGLPEGSLDVAEPPFAQDASGLPLDVGGESFLRLTMRGGTKQQEDGTSSYDGQTNFDPGHPVLVDLVEGGDFEAQSTWYFGLAADSCVRVTTLEDDGSARLVIDIEH